ncbi:MAG: peptide-methionine (S)-S-oxide reductase MsrA [Pseudomonadota bacterium]
MEKATLAAGCFWGVESTFRNVPGVKDVVVGYTGGHVEDPSYEQVCRTDTGHAEAVEITYDPNEVNFEALLNVFWDSHNPTTLNRQGPDVGSQYRSAIFFHDSDQQVIAEESKTKLNESGRFANPVVTEVSPASQFYRAEEYHQRYFEKHGLSHCKI